MSSVGCWRDRRSGISGWRRRGRDLAAAMTGKGYVAMIGARSLTEKIALSILDREGIAAIWQLQATWT
jgi:hypothetical protein